MSEKVTCFGPLLLKSLYVDPELVPRFRPRFFFKKLFFLVPENGKGWSGHPEKGGPCSDISGRKNTYPRIPKTTDPGHPQIQLLKACVMWQWSQHLHRQCVLQGKEPLLINLDETSVPVVFTGGKGNIVAVRGKNAWRTMPRQRLGRAHVRMFFTHVGIICNKPEIQPLLPQVIFVAAHTITLAEWRDLTANLPNNVYVKRMPKGWNNTTQHRIIIRILGLILQPLLTTMQPILSFDAAPLHLAQEVLREMTSAHIWYIVVPARLTWMLQPLDSHAFVLYKNWLRRGFTDEAGNGDTRSFMRRMLDLVIGAIRYILQGRKWQKAFEQNGFAPNLDSISDFVRHQCGPVPLPPLPLACPTADQVRICWPRNRPFYDELVMSAIPGYAPPVPALMDAEPSVDHTVPLLALPGRSSPLLLHALGMAVPVVPAPLEETPGIGDVVPDVLAL